MIHGLLKMSLRNFPGSTNEYGPGQPELGVPGHDPRIPKQHRFPAAHGQRARRGPPDHRLRQEAAVEQEGTQ